MFQLADAYEFQHIEASAKTGENVEQAFERLTRLMLTSYERKVIMQTKHSAIKHKLAFTLGRVNNNSDTIVCPGCINYLQG